MSLWFLLGLNLSVSDVTEATNIKTISSQPKTLHDFLLEGHHDGIRKLQLCLTHGFKVH